MNMRIFPKESAKHNEAVQLNTTQPRWDHKLSWRWKLCVFLLVVLYHDSIVATQSMSGDYDAKILKLQNEIDRLNAEVAALKGLEDKINETVTLFEQLSDHVNEWMGNKTKSRPSNCGHNTNTNTYSSTSVTCHVTGLCHGHLMGHTQTSSYNQCLTECNTTNNCAWFTFEQPITRCYLFADCISQDETCDQCMSGETGCLPMIEETGAEVMTGQETEADAMLEPRAEGILEPETVAEGYTKIIIATGFGDGGNYLSSVEVIDTSDSNTVCNDLPPYHKATEGATGGLIGNTPLICGGPFEDTCYALVKNNWQLVTSMTAGRYYSASAVLGNSLMVTGGANLLDSSDLVGLDSSKPGPTLPGGVHEHCAVSLNDSTIMIIGGWYQDLPRTTTYYYHLDIDHWIRGPDLNTGRYAHSCGTIKSSDQVTVVAVGGLREDSVEVLRLGSSEWSYGTPLPLKIGFGQLVPDATGKGVLLIGGSDYTNNIKLNSIYHMACVGCDWVKMAQSLKIARAGHVAIPVHDDLVTCE